MLPPPPPAGALKRTLAATTTDADHAAVAISRHRATNAREREDPIEAARHSVTAQLSEQLATMRPKALCRADKVS